MTNHVCKLIMSQSVFIESALSSAFNRNGSVLIKCEFEDTSAQDQLQSNAMFVTAVVETEERTTKYPLIVKLEPSNTEMRRILHCDLQFFNEVFMYSELFPFLEKYDTIKHSFSRFYHGVGEIGISDNNIVVLEDLRPLGYRLTNEKGFLDYDHLYLALSKLARFHALSYLAKREYPEKFKSLITCFKEATYHSDKVKFHNTIVACLNRAVEPLINKGKSVEVLQRFLSRVNENFLQLVNNLTAPSEPSAVICHGDFCRNNMLFKYEEGKPIDVKFFDMATPRYSSPAIDIAFFIFLNSSKNLRKAHLQELLEAYYHSLKTSISGLEVPSFEEFMEDFNKTAVYGLIPCSFFLPMMLFEAVNNLEHVTKITDEDMVKMYTTRGGEEGTRVLCDIVEDLLDIGCLSLKNEILFPI